MSGANLQALFAANTGAQPLEELVDSCALARVVKVQGKTDALP
jgi:hypothetical protein